MAGWLLLFLSTYSYVPWQVAVAAVLAGGLLAALVCTRAGGDSAAAGIAVLQQSRGSVQSLSSILGVDSQGRRAIEHLIAKTEKSWQVYLCASLASLQSAVRRVSQHP